LFSRVAELFERPSYNPSPDHRFNRMGRLYRRRPDRHASQVISETSLSNQSVNCADSWLECGRTLYTRDYDVQSIYRRLEIFLPNNRVF